MQNSRLTAISFGLIGLIAVSFFFWNLGKNPLEKWDEAIHAQVTHEMLVSGNWFELTWNYQPYFRKPPLRFWLQGVVSSIFGENEFTIRFWSAAAGVLTALLIALWAWQAFKNLPTVWLAVLTFLSGKYLFYHAFRTGETDGLLAFFTLLALWIYWRSWTKPKYLYWLALVFGLTVLTKFSAAGFASIAILLHLILTRKFKLYTTKVWLKAIGIGLLTIAPWLIIQIILRGHNFFNEYFQADILERATVNLYGFTAGPGWYWEIFIKRFFPLACFALPALLWFVWQGWKEKNQLYFLWLLFLAITTAIVSLNASKTNWYLLPLYPVLALILGKWLYSWKEFPKKLFELLLIAWGLIFAFESLPSMIDQASRLKWLIPQHYLPQLNGKAGRWLLGFILAAVLSLIYWLAKKYQLKKLWLGAMSVIMLWMFGLTFGGQISELKLKRGEEILPQARAYLIENKRNELYLYNVYLAHEPTVVYYLGNEKNTQLISLSSPAAAKPGQIVLEKILDRTKEISGKTILESPDFQLVKIP